jgi:hypothetical protein
LTPEQEPIFMTRVAGACLGGGSKSSSDGSGGGKGHGERRERKGAREYDTGHVGGRADAKRTSTERVDLGLCLGRLEEEH